MAPHALVLSALHTLTRRQLPTTGKALVSATALDPSEVVAAVRLLSRRGLARFVGSEARLTLEGFALASSIVARRSRRGRLHVLPVSLRAPTLRQAA